MGQNNLRMKVIGSYLECVSTLLFHTPAVFFLLKVHWIEDQPVFIMQQQGSMSILQEPTKPFQEDRKNDSS